MKWIILGIILLLAFILLSRIYITFQFTYKQKKQVVNLSVSLYHIRLFKKEMNIANEQESMFENVNMEKFSLQLQETIHMIQSLPTIFDLLISRLRICQLNWTTEAGTGEAAKTGMASGALWAVKGILIGFITEKGNVYQKPNIQVIPNYQRRIIQSQMDCIVSIRVGKAMYAFLKLMRLVSSKEGVFI